MKTLNFTLFFTIAVVLLMNISCKENTVSQEPPDEEIEIVDTVSVDLPADEGEVGLVINAREIFRKGYTAKVAEVKFHDYSEFDEILEIHPVTNVAILRIHNEDLTDEEKNAFAAGVAIDIFIYDESQTLLAEYYDDDLVLDDTNTPLTIQTQLEYNVPPVRLREGIPYYIQPEEPIPGDGTWPAGSVLKASTTRLYNFDVPDPDRNTHPDDIHFTYKYFFSPVTDSTYHILRSNSTKPHVPTHYFRLHDSELIVVDEGVNEESSAIEFVLDQSADGWVRIREAGTNRYLTITEGSSRDNRKALRLRADTNHRFRFISANIRWEGEDRGTEFSRSVIPPAEIDFAYAATIKNCAPGTLTEEVGAVRERTSVYRVVTTESLQLFASLEATVGFTTGVSAGAAVPGVGQVSASVEYSAELSLTTTATTSNKETLDETDEETNTVSRIRTLEIVPFTGVEVFDAVRVVKNARVPFTQVLRLRAQYINGPALSGDEIMTQLQVNFVEGVPLNVGNDYVDVGLSGNVHINEMFETETGVNEIVGACD